jgi:hypothetical protein
MKPNELLSHFHGAVRGAALIFEARWTTLALRNVDPGLAEALHDQRNMFIEACVTGSARDIKLHGAATLRGYAVATKAMEAAKVPDDAYLIGRCPQTGTRVAISTDKNAVERVRAMFPDDTVAFFTADEVATLLATAEMFSAVAAVKRAWPGAEVLSAKSKTTGEEADA